MSVASVIMLTSPIAVRVDEDDGLLVGLDDESSSIDPTRTFEVSLDEVVVFAATPAFAPLNLL